MGDDGWTRQEAGWYTHALGGILRGLFRLARRSGAAMRERAGGLTNGRRCVYLYVRRTARRGKADV